MLCICPVYYIQQHTAHTRRYKFTSALHHRSLVTASIIYIRGIGIHEALGKSRQKLRDDDGYNRKVIR